MLARMHKVYRNSTQLPGFRCSVKYCTKSLYKYPEREDEFTRRPQYPEMKENRGVNADRDFSNGLKKQPTVEEKIFLANVPRAWGWKCFMVYEGEIPFNNLKFAQHMTRTHLIRTDRLPDYYDHTAEKASFFSKQILNYVIESLEYQLHVRRKKLLEEPDSFEREKEFTKIVVNELNRVIIKAISADECHIKSLQTDLFPRIEASWRVNSLNETVVKKEYPDGIPLDELPEEYLDRPSDKYIQYIGHPLLQLRHSHPLPIIMDKKNANIFDYSVPVFEYDPHIVLGYNLDRRHVTNIPGFWPGDDREFSFLSYHSTNHIAQRPPTYGLTDADEAVLSQIIFASFGWLMSLACYQGFSCYNDVTYPLVTQTVATNGQKFVLGTYQLNTTETYHKNPFENSSCNVCWVSRELPLFEEYKDGKLKGFNEQVLQSLLQLYINKPKSLTDVKLKPYLGEKVKHIADYEDVEKREWLEHRFKHFSANKPPSRTDLMYEVYDWERIFKIQFRMRPRDPLKRPFELRKNPYHQKMSEIRPPYIPKCLRPDKNLPKWKQRKYAKTFYPEY